MGPTRLPLTATSSFGTGRCAELQVHVTEVMATAAEQRDLIARLEQDLSTIQSIQRPDAEVSPPPTLPPHHLPRALSASLNTGSPSKPAHSSGSWCPPAPPHAPQRLSPTYSLWVLSAHFTTKAQFGMPSHRAQGPKPPASGHWLGPLPWELWAEARPGLSTHLTARGPEAPRSGKAGALRTPRGHQITHLILQMKKWGSGREAGLAQGHTAGWLAGPGSPGL